MKSASQVNMATDKHFELDVQVMRSFDELLPMRQEWDDFMESIGAEVFLSYDWCRVWWNYYGKGRQLFIFFFRRSGQLCAVLPMFGESFGIGAARLRVVKLLCSDFMPITLTIPIREDVLHIICRSLLVRLSAVCQWDLVYLGTISGKYCSVNQIVDALEESSDGSFWVNPRECGVQTYFKVSDSWDNQIETLSKRQRTKTRKVYKELASKGVALASHLASKESLQEMFQDFVQMHQFQWQQIGMAGHFGDWPSSREFHEEMVKIQAACDRLRLLQICLDESVIGYDYLYKFGQTYQWFLSARCHANAGGRIDFHRVSFGEKVKTAIRDNVKYIDGGRGYYEYKIVMGGKLYPVHGIFVGQCSILAGTKVRLFRWFVRIVDAWYYKLWRRRIVPRLRIKSKPLWCWWIRAHVLS